MGHVHGLCADAMLLARISGLQAALGTFNYCTQLFREAPPSLRIQLRLQARDLGVCLLRILVKTLNQLGCWVVHLSAHAQAQ